MPKPLIADLPYPTTDGICPDVVTLRIISPAYASATGELNAVLQYVYHSYFFRNKGYTEIAEGLISIAIAEMIHLQLLGNTIFALGSAPVYTQYPPESFNFYSAKYVSYSRSLVNMLEDDLRDEKRTVCTYSKIIARIKNENVKKIVCRIRDDELLHIEKLEQMLTQIKC